MYSQRVIERNLEQAGDVIRQRHGLPRSWHLRQSTHDEVEEMRHHFSTLLDGKGQPIRRFTREESLWILAESTICKLDFRYFGQRYGKLQDERARVVYFLPNLAQEIILNVIARDEESGLALMYMFLKARQLGITTLFQLILAHRILFYRNVNGLEASADPDKSRKMARKFEFVWQNVDWWLRPRRTAYRAGELIEFGDLNSALSIQWGNQANGIARGDTPSVAHLSELADFEHPELLVDASLIRTIHEHPFSILALESTAAGIGDWWHETWKLYVRMEAQGIARLRPIFLPWFVGRDLYPTSGSLRRRPIPEGWRVPDFVEAHARAAQAYVRATPLLREALGHYWEMPLEQKWFYFVEYTEAKAKRQLHIFLQEMPANPDEAFQNANPVVFDHEVLAVARTAAQASIPVGVFEITGSGIPATLPVSGRRIELPSLPVVAPRPDGDFEHFSLSPIALDGWPDHDGDGKLYVWEWAEEGEEYGLALDPAEGVGQDSSAIVVLKKATPEHPDMQVAEWASNRTAPHDLWPYALSIIWLYTMRQKNGRIHYPRAVIETNINAGDAVQTEMMKRGWPSFHQELDLTRTHSPDLHKLGWRTNVKTRPKLISLARKHIRDGLIKVRSPWLVDEMSTLQYNPEKKRIEAVAGRHDDRFMALGMLLASWYDPERYGVTPLAWRGKQELERWLEQLPVYGGDRVVGRAVGRLIPAGKKVDSRALVA